MRNGYRLAYTTRTDSFAPGGLHVVILYVGKKDDPAHKKGNDMWDVVHELFGEANPESDHVKPPCCEKDWPGIDDATLDEFVARLKRVQKGR